MVKEFSESSLWNNEEDRIKLWLECNAKFEEFKMDPSATVQFFEVFDIFVVSFSRKCINPLNLDFSIFETLNLD